MKKSDKIETRVKIELDSREGFTWKELWECSVTTKALLKHIIDNDLRHIWRIILGILSYLIVATIGFFLRGAF